MVDRQDFSRFFDLSLDLLCIASIDGYFKHVNPAFENRLGFTSEELLARPLIDFVHPDDRQATLDEITKLSEGDPAVRFENRYLTKGGEYRWLAWSLAPAPDGLLYAIARDITDEKKRELELQQLLRSYETAEKSHQSAFEQLELADARIGVVLNAAADGFLLVDDNRTVILANPAIRKMFGLESQDLIGNSSVMFRSVLQKNVVDPEAFNKRIDAIYRDRTLVVEDELVEIRHPVPLQLSRNSVPIVTEDGKYLGRLWVYRNVTKSRAEERARAEFELKNRQMEALTFAKTTFISTISHELRTPLTSILTFSRLLKSDGPKQDAERRTKHLDAIIRSGDRLHNLVNQLLDIADLESELLQIKAAPFVLEEAIEEVVATTAPLLERKSQQIKTSLDDQHAPVNSDRNRVEQILGNLVSNASKFSEEKTEIEIRAVTEEDQLRISVIDNGKGIQRDQFGQLFEPFTQLDDPLTRTSQGPGLGLTISRKLARAMGGDLEVESTLGTGSEFTLILPVAMPESEAA